MVWYNDKERGVRLGDGAQPLGYSLSCAACGHTARVRAATALKIWGPDAYARDVAASLKCARCGARKGRLQVISETRPQRSADPDDYWGPGPDYPEING